MPPAGDAGICSIPCLGVGRSSYAGCGGEGCIDGFTLLELIRAQLVSANPERTIADSKTIEVTRLRITDAGRRVLEGANA